MSRLKTDAIRNVNASVDGITLDTSGNVAIPNELQLADKIVHTGDTNTAIRFSGADTVSVETAGTERLRVTSGGSLIVGNQTSTSYKLCVSEAAHTRVEVISTSNNSAGAWFKVFNSGTLTSQSTIRTSGGSLQVYTGTTSEAERLRIDSSGRLLVGSTTHNTTLDVARFHKASGHTSLSLTCGSNSDVGFHLKQSTREWKIFSDGNLRFYDLTDSAERLRITSGGNIGLGTTSPGLKLHIQDGALSSAPTPNSNCDMVVEGTTSTGIQFLSSGQTQLRFGDAASTAAGAIIYDHSADNFKLNYSNSGALTFNDGSGEVGRFTPDGLTFNGETASANALDSYEEGTWTPSPTAGTFQTAEGRYTKIGRYVFCTFNVQFENGGGGNFAQINGFPFDNIASNAGENSFSYGYGTSNANGNLVGVLYTGTALIFADYSGNNYRYNSGAINNRIIRGGVTYMSSV